MIFCLLKVIFLHYNWFPNFCPQIWFSGWRSLKWTPGWTWINAHKSECRSKVPCWGSYCMFIWSLEIEVHVFFFSFSQIFLFPCLGVHLQIRWLVDIFRAKIVDISEYSLTIEVMIVRILLQSLFYPWPPFYIVLMPHEQRATWTCYLLWQYWLWMSFSSDLFQDLIFSALV